MSREQLPDARKYPAHQHAHKVFSELLKTAGPAEETITIYLQGEKTLYRHDTDRELPFRQESNFYYLTGCDIPSSRLVATCRKAGDDLAIEIILFIPELDELDVMWSGMPLLPNEVAEELDVDQVLDLSAFNEMLAKLAPSTIHVLPEYSLPELSNSFNTSDKYLLMACQEARLTKTSYEIELIQQANDISSRAHEGVMRSLGSGNLKSEYEATAVFNYYCARQNSKGLAYEVIAASGTNAGTLHYIKNHRSFPSSEHSDLLLLDAGCEWKYYAADISRTFPVGNGGKFSKEARDIYQLVEQMQDAVYMHLRPGCVWEKMQLLMHKTLAAGLIKLGILKSKAVIKPDDSNEKDDAQSYRDQAQLVEEILESGITAAFCGHGLGHSLGLDVHDSALAARPEGPSSHPLAKYLRFRRVLEEGHVVTVEPGCYFNPFQLKPFMDSPYLDQEVLKRYMPVGGVRIEDDILVTKNGFHNFTSVPRSVEEVEKLCQMNVSIGK